MRHLGSGHSDNLVTIAQFSNLLYVPPSALEYIRAGSIIMTTVTNYIRKRINMECQLIWTIILD